MIISKSENYKNNFDLGITNKKLLKQKLKNIVIIGEVVDNFQKINIIN